MTGEAAPPANDADLVVPVRSATTGAVVGEARLPASVFGVEVNVPVLHQVVVAHLAGIRAGTSKTKTRAEVSGGGAKPHRQKGTGRARQGSIRAPHFRGGGVAHGPQPRSYRQRTPKKMVRLALRAALSDRAALARVAVVDAWPFTTPRTKEARQALERLGLGSPSRALTVLGSSDDMARKSLRNLTSVEVVPIAGLGAYDVLRCDWVVFTQDSLARFCAAQERPIRGRRPASAGTASDRTASDRTAS